MDDPYLKGKLATENPGIILWMLEGLERLVKNNFKFTVSEKSARLKEELMEEDNNIKAFLRSDGYIAFSPEDKATTRQLYDVYQRWYLNNAERSMAASTFSKHLVTNAQELKVLIWRYFLSYWNNRRICSANGGLPPMIKRRQYYEDLELAA